MKILLADDHQLVRHGLRNMLDRLAERVELLEAGSVDEVLAILSKDTSVDLVMLDLRMPGMDGFNGIDRVRAARPDAPVVILSASEQRYDIEESLRRGAAGYIPKSLTANETLDALGQVMRGDIFDPRGRPSRGAKPEPHFNELSPQERRVLALLAEGCQNKEIARRLKLQEVTVKAHLRQVFRKLHVANRTQAVKLVLQSGRNW